LLINEKLKRKIVANSGEYVKDHFDFPDPEAEIKTMFTHGLNNPDYEL